MRGAAARVQTLLRQPLPRRATLPPSSPFASASAPAVSVGAPSLSLAAELSIADEVLAILTTVPSIESPLESLLPLFSSHLVSAVLASSPPPDPRPAFRFFNWAALRRRLRSRASYSLIVSSLRRDFQAAWECLAELKRDGVPVTAHAFEALIYAYDESGQPGKAVESFERMTEFGVFPTTYVYNAVLSALVKDGIVLLAVAVYNQMLKSNCVPNRSTFHVLINGHCKEMETEKALEVFDEMSTRGIVPDAMVYNIVIHSLCRTSRLGDALRLLQSMKLSGVSPCPITYNSVFHGYLKSGQLGEAFKLLEEFKREGFTLRLNDYTSLIDGLFRAGMFDEACQWYQTLLDNNVQPDCILYTVMIRGYSEARNVEQAFSFLDEMTCRGIKPDTFCYNTLIKGLCDAGHLNKAHSLKLEISRNKLFPDSTTDTIIICGLCSQGLILEAQQIFDEMGKQGCFPTVRTFNALMNGLCKAGKLKEAHIMFCKMEMGRNPAQFLRLCQAPDLVSDSNRLRGLVERLCHSGHVVKAYNLLHSLANSGIVEPDIRIYTVLIQSYCKDGNFIGAANLVKGLQLRGLYPDAFLYGTLIDGLQSHRKFQEALDIFDQMLRSGCTPSLQVYYTVTKTLCRMGNISEAMKLWLNYISKRNKLFEEEATFIATAKKLFEKGSVKDMVACLIKMDLKRGSNCSSPYCIWLSGFCETGKIHEALQIFSALREHDIDTSPSSCNILVNALCREGRLDDAIEIMFYAFRKGYKLDSPHVYILIQRLWSEGKKDVAIELASRMHQDGYKLELCFADRETAPVQTYCNTTLKKWHRCSPHASTVIAFEGIFMLCPFKQWCPRLFKHLDRKRSGQSFEVSVNEGEHMDVLGKTISSNVPRTVAPTDESIESTGDPSS